MNPGGIETWLMHVLRNIDRSQFQMDFCLFGSEPGMYATEVGGSGARSGDVTWAAICGRSVVDFNTFCAKENTMACTATSISFRAVCFAGQRRKVLLFASHTVIPPTTAGPTF